MNAKLTTIKRQLAAASLSVFSMVGSMIGLATPLQAGEDRFEGYEIRVIRPRFMTKSNRFELGAQGAFIMNQTFIYTYMASGLLDYHFSESLALEVNASYGFSLDKQDKTILKKDFNITTTILRTEYIAAGGLLWTPIYGKTQLPSGEVLYFDSFLSAEAGMTGVYYDYKNCVVSQNASSSTATTVAPAPATKTYPSVGLGFGQKYFVSEDMAVRWDVRDYFFIYPLADGSCTPGSGDGGSQLHQNVTIQLGMSLFL
jgi:outer membrane beta-barrel protein